MFLKNFISKSLAGLCALSIFLTPINASAQSYYYDNNNNSQCCEAEQNPCCDEGGGFGKIGLILGAAAAGAAAGAITASAIGGRRGHSGDEGPVGPTGPVGPVGPPGPAGTGPFVPDLGETITFDFGITLDLGLFADGPLPFVETPEGEVITAAAFDPTSIIAQTRTIAVDDPVFGTYHFGLELPAALVATSLVLTVTITTTRGPTTTVELVPITLSLLSPAQQVTGEFTYGPVGTLP